VSKPSSAPWKTAGATLAALLAFAANSLLCRGALSPEVPLIDARSFTAVRLLTGALVLAIIVGLRSRRTGPRFAGNWLSALALFAYALAFSLAYHSLTAGIGALILFGSVQLTMIVGGILRGERPGDLECSGLAIAFCGLIYLVAGGDEIATLVALLMTVAGVSWGIYSLRGRGTRDPIAATAGNFALAVPMALVAWLTGIGATHVTSSGLTLAALSGGITSGLGYVIWYHALPKLTAMRAALVQLAVPILTALLAALMLGEAITERLVIAAAVVLGGITIAIGGRLRRI
jgi:drug/metabolite transporter (DMT)-like permease